MLTAPWKEALPSESQPVRLRLARRSKTPVSWLQKRSESLRIPQCFQHINRRFRIPFRARILMERVDLISTGRSPALRAREADDPAWRVVV